MRSNYCDNSSRQASGISQEIPSCATAPPELATAVAYSHAEVDINLLCQACADQLEKLARREGYYFQSRELP